MTVSEYEDRFRSSTPSLHQIFAAAWGPNLERQRGRRLWGAAALVAVITMTCEVASHHAPHFDTGNGSHIWESCIGGNPTDHAP